MWGCLPNRKPWSLINIFVLFLAINDQLEWQYLSECRIWTSQQFKLRSRQCWTQPRVLWKPCQDLPTRHHVYERTSHSGSLPLRRIHTWLEKGQRKKSCCCNGCSYCQKRRQWQAFEKGVQKIDPETDKPGIFLSWCLLHHSCRKSTLNHRVSYYLRNFGIIT